MISAQDVAEFLERNPDFFDQHPQVLEQLQVPHSKAGNAVSLVEKQVKILRERQLEHRERFTELVNVARANEALAANVHKLALRLLRCDTAPAVFKAVETSMREDFDVTPVRLVPPEILPQAMRQLLDADRARCGQLSPAQRGFLFPDEAEAVASVALIPIGSRSSRGVLALGSRDAARFHPGMSTEFIERIGEMINVTLTRFGIEPDV